MPRKKGGKAADGTKPIKGKREGLHRPGGGTTSAASKTRDDRYARFIEELARTGNITGSAKTAGVSRRNIYRERENVKEFREAWDDAVEEAVDELEREARRRAVEGVAKPVFYQGVQCGSIQEFSDTLLIFLLKGARPEKYRHEAYLGANAAQSATEIARQLHEAAGAMAASVPTPPSDSEAVTPDPFDGLPSTAPEPEEPQP